MSWFSNGTVGLGDQKMVWCSAEPRDSEDFVLSRWWINTEVKNLEDGDRKRDRKRERRDDKVF